MARKTKARSRAAAGKKKPAARKSKKTKRTAAPKSRKGSGKRGSEVEKRWTLYLKQRSALEVAVEAVEAAASELRSAREVETARRKEFDQSKNQLEELLEVDSPPGRSGRDKKAIDFTRAGRPPTRADEQEARG